MPRRKKYVKKTDKELKRSKVISLPSPDDPRPYRQYDSDVYPYLAYVTCSEGGFTLDKLAKLFRVCKQTIKMWQRKYPEFKDAIQRGRDEYDTINVEAALVKRATGYEFDEDTMEQVVDENTGERVLRVTKRVKRHVVPDPKAAIFYLRNRNRERWPDTQKHDGSIRVTLTHEEMLDLLEGREPVTKVEAAAAATISTIIQEGDSTDDADEDNHED